MTVLALTATMDVMGAGHHQPFNTLLPKDSNQKVSTLTLPAPKLARSREVPSRFQDIVRSLDAVVSPLGSLHTQSQSPLTLPSGVATAVVSSATADLPSITPCSWSV